MNDTLRGLANLVLQKEDYQSYAKAIHSKDYEKALEVASNAYDNALEVLLDSVYKDECDFVIMAHYRHSKDFLTVTQSLEYDK